MPGTITSDQTTIKDAELTTDYLVLGTFASAQALNDDIKVQGTNAINGRVSANSAWTLAAAAAAIDMTVADRHVWVWVRLITWPSADTKANGGVGISMSSDVTPTLTGVSPSNGPTNSKTWYVGGSNTEVTTGWVCYCVDPNSTPDLTLGTPVMTSIDRVGVRCKVTGTVSNKTLNLHHDIVRYGTGLTVKDGTSGSPVAFADIATADALNANAWGVVTQQGGIYFVAGKLYFGTSGQTALTYFKDTNKIVVFPFFPVAASFYEWRLAGAGSFLTTFALGTYSGGLASAGCTIKGAGSGSSIAIWTLTASAANTLCLLYASIFSEMRSAAFKSDSEIRSCTFDNSGEITAGGATFTDCLFLNLRTTAPISAVYQIRVTTSTPTITDCEFVNCATAILWDRAADTSGKLDGCSFTSGGTGHAIELGANTPTTLSLVNIAFSGYGGTPGSNAVASSGSTAAAIYNNSGKAITINVSGGSTPAVRNGAGSTTIVNSTVAVQLTGLAAGSEVRAYLNASPYTEQDGTDSTAGSTHTLSLPSGVAVDIVILGPTSDPAVTYTPVRINNQTFSVAQSVSSGQLRDRNFSNP